MSLPFFKQTENKQRHFLTNIFTRRENDDAHFHSRGTLLNIFARRVESAILS
jgi:hypothetical protein